MNLVIDIGNTRTKFSVFNHGEEMIAVPLTEMLPSDIDVLLKEHPDINKAIVCSVKNYSAELKSCLQQKFTTFVELDETTPLPVENLYETRETLGKDRMAAVVGAAHIYPGANVLVIDAGTAITYDVVNERNQFLGGKISPGLDMRYKALNQFTDRLPFVQFEENHKLFGRTTIDAIQTGVQQSVLFEVDSTINAFKEFYKNLYVIITGGNTNFFDKKLKNSFFVHYNLIAIGLNRILEHNGEI